MWTELWIVFTAVLAGMIWTPALVAAPLIVALFTLLRLVVEKRLPGPTPADLAILCLILLLPINYLMAAIPERTTSALFRLLGGIGLYFAVVNWCWTINRLRWLIAITGVASLGLILLSPFAVNWISYKLLFIPHSLYERFSLLITDPINPNILAGTMIAIFPLILAILLFAFNKLTWIERFLYPLILIGASGALLLSQSRGALLALLVALLVLFLLRSAWFWSLPLLGLAAIATAAILWGLNNFQAHIVDLIYIGGLSQRTDIWYRAIFMIQDFPLTGVGIGNFSDAFRIFYPMSLDPTELVLNAHNIFLTVGANLGIPGLVLWLAVVLAALVAAWKVFRTGKQWQHPWLTAIGAGLFCCQLAILIHGMFDSVLWGEVWSAPLLWWLWGLTMAALNLSHHLTVTGHNRSSSPAINSQLFAEQG
jgi:putative inorganic carbon (HCO3(-)) transporter